jgi:hypothetical protein
MVNGSGFCFWSCTSEVISFNIFKDDVRIDMLHRDGDKANV